MADEQFPIPARTNLAIAGLQLLGLLGCIYLAAGAASWAVIILLSAAYSLLMNSAYAMLHEAEHNLLHPNKALNDGCGIVLALFFPAPFHLLRQGHIGHHMRNRSDDEAFDFYFENENPLWKHMQLYGTITGFFWAVIAIGNFIAALAPGALVPRYGRFDRPTEAFLKSLNPRYRRAIQLEAIAAISLHLSLKTLWAVPVLNYAALFFGFGFLWSAMQYVHHFGTVRDVHKGARNLRTWRPVDLLWLNHNFHLNHHISPTVPWIYLPGLYEGEEFKRGSLVLAYLKMWRGPRFTTERVENRYAGKIIK